MIYELITPSNIKKALKIQQIIFPEESAKWCYKLSLSNNDYRYYLVYDNDKIIGVTGLYTKNHFKDKSIWIGWYGILSEYRKKGLGKKVFTDTIYMAYIQSIYNPDTKYIRLYTGSEDNPDAQPLYKKYMDICEEYNNPNDTNWNNTCLIYTKAINNPQNDFYWNNRYIGLKEEYLLMTT